MRYAYIEARLCVAMFSASSDVCCRNRSYSRRHHRTSRRSRSRSSSRGRSRAGTSAAADSNVLDMTYEDYLEQFERMRQQKAATALQVIKSHVISVLAQGMVYVCLWSVVLDMTYNDYLEHLECMRQQIAADFLQFNSEESNKRTCSSAVSFLCFSSACKRTHMYRVQCQLDKRCLVKRGFAVRALFS